MAASCPFPRLSPALLPVAGDVELEVGLAAGRADPYEVQVPGWVESDVEAVGDALTDDGIDRRRGRGTGDGRGSEGEARGRWGDQRQVGADARGIGWHIAHATDGE